jgi:hypothetical protein
MFKILAELVKVAIPDIRCVLTSAREDMSSRFRFTTARAFVVGLVFPFDKSSAHSTIARGVLGDPSTAAGF